jgi:hypothetical protein
VLGPGSSARRGSTIAAVSTITGVRSRRRGLVSTQPMILSFVVPATEMSTKLPLVRKPLRGPPAFCPAGWVRGR